MMCINGRCACLHIELQPFLLHNVCYEQCGSDAWQLFLATLGLLVSVKLRNEIL